MSKPATQATAPRRAFKTAMRAVSDLTSDPKNARTRDDAAVASIARSLARYGQQKPIVVTAAGEVIAGNGTLAAAVSLGWKRIAVHVTELSGADVRGFAVADNRTAELAGWDEVRLVEILAELEAAEGGALEATGFDDAAFEALRERVAEEAAGAGDGPPDAGGRKGGPDTEGQDERNFGDDDPFAAEGTSFRVLVSCRDAEHAAAVVASLEASGEEGAEVIEL